jgi:hypothetical protein
MMMLNAHYAEFVGSASCVNAPNLFVHLWAIVSPWLSKEMRSLTTAIDADETPAAVARLAPPSSLPRRYGGACAEMPADVRESLGLDASSARLKAIYDGTA